MADADTGSKPVDQGTLMADIDRTRAELARTIDAISDRVSPRRNVERATGQLRERASQIEGQLRGRATRIEGRLRERAGQIDPAVAGVAVAAATVVIGVTVLLLVRRRKR